MNCLNCDKLLEKWQKKYCSRSCAAKVNNRKRKLLNYCKICGVEIDSHRIYCSHKCFNINKSAIILENWKTTGAKLTIKPIKKYLLEQQENKCAVCNMDNVWNSKEIVFILDHIDGNSNNNSKDNLRLVCPNCDSQLPTFKSRNKGNGRYSRNKRRKEGKSY